MRRRRYYTYYFSKMYDFHRFPNYKSFYEIFRMRVQRQMWALQDFRFPRESLSFKGGFFSSLMKRIHLLLREDKFHLVNFFDFYIKRFRSLNWKEVFYWLLLWVFFLPLLYFSYRLFLHIVWRSPLYLLAPLESFFENFLFLHFKEERMPRISFFYRSIIQSVKRFFRASWGYPLWHFLYSLEWRRRLFWRILYHIYVKEPLLHRIYRPAWRFLRAIEILELEVELCGWGPLLRRIFRPITRPISRLVYRLRQRIRRWRFLLFTRKGRKVLRIYRRRLKLHRRRLWKLRWQELSLFCRRSLWRVKIKIWDLHSLLSLALKVFRAEPKSCILLVFLYIVIAIVFLLEWAFHLFIRNLSPNLFPSWALKTLKAFFRRRGLL